MMRGKPNGFDHGVVPILSPQLLSMEDWRDATIPEPDFLLSEVFSTTSRGLLAAPTGLGKTMFGMALGLAIATGNNFLHWQGRRPAKVLYVDGEMSQRLMKRRIDDTLQRAGFDSRSADSPENFHVCCLDSLPKRPPPLNTEAGQEWFGRWILDEYYHGYEFIVFDNVQSLLAGNMAEEEPWKAVLPWTHCLTQRSIAQLWIDHTGNDKGRPYGSAQKLWQMDVGILLEEVSRPWTDVAFKLKFLKARERTPENRADFAPVIITLESGQWFVETIDETKSNKPAAPAPKPKSPSPAGERWHSALVDAAVKHGQPRPESGNRPSVHKSEWLPEAERLGLIEPLLSGSSRTDTNRRLARVSKYQAELIEAAWIAVNGDLVWSIRTNA